MDAIKRTWWLFGTIFLLWALYPFIISSDLIKVWKPWMDWSLRGQLGDSFGALNTLFSGMALAGLGANLYMQGVQIKKLEEKEQQNEDLLKQQVSVMRQTALLQYYNELINKLEQQFFDLEDQFNMEFEKYKSTKNIQSNSHPFYQHSKSFQIPSLEIITLKRRLDRKQNELNEQVKVRDAIIEMLNRKD